MRKFASAVCVGAVLSLTGATAASAGTLDQQQTGDASSQRVGWCDSFVCTGGERQISPSQSFTAGLSGWLDRVDLKVSQAGAARPVTVEIRGAGPDGCPTGDVLATGTVGPAGVQSMADWVAVSFATPAKVTAGGRYSIAAYTALGTTYAWRFEPDDAAYAGGTRCERVEIPPGNPLAVWEPKLGDHAFRTYVDGGKGPGDGGGGAGAGRLETVITKAPKKRTKKRTVKFRFEASARGATFECRLKGKRAKRSEKRWRSCSSPKKYKRLAPGKYRFLVVAKTAGDADPTPAKRRFRIAR